jgi:peptidoglycan/LPS O-acetylase OafA/YrhL
MPEKLSLSELPPRQEGQPRRRDRDPTSTASDTLHWPFLDLVRFGAALLVLFGHSRGLYFESISKAPDAGVATRLFYLATGLQHEGVVLFFVVSGFLVGGSAWRKFEKGEFKARLYLINRFSRIYLVLIPALVFAVLIDRLGANLFAETRFYAMRPLFPSGVSDGWTLDQIPCHLAALQGVFCAPIGADPPLWSLGWEWLFYLISPVLFAICLVPLRLSLRIVALICFWASIITVIGLGEGLFWFMTWLMGMAASLLVLRRPVPIAPAIAGLALCATSLVVSRAVIVSATLTDLGIGAGLAVALSCPIIANGDVLSRFAAKGASFSYSLYLIHLPLGVFVGGLLERLGLPSVLMQPGPLALAAFALTVASAITGAMLFARATESHTAAFRRFLTRLPAVRVQHRDVPPS